MFDLLMSLAYNYKQSYGTAMLNKCCQSSSVRHVERHSPKNIQEHDTTHWCYRQWNV